MTATNKMLTVVDLPTEAAPNFFRTTQVETMPNSDVQVLFVGLVSGEGGASAIMRKMASRMSELGVSVKIVVPASDTAEVYAEQCRQRGVRVELTELLVPWAEAGRSLISLREQWAALRFLYKNRAPIVHFHLGGTSALSHYLLRAMSILRFPKVFVTPNNNVDDPIPGSPWARFWAANAPQRIGKIICVSEGGRQRQLRYGIAPEQTILINNGIELEHYSNGDPSAIRRSLGIDGHARLVVVTGRINQGKRPLDALAAFQLISGKFPDAHLVFVGKGSLTEETKEAARDAGLGGRVHFPGYVSNVTDWLAAATVWLLPTESEGFSLAVLEAMAARCAVVTTDCPGNDEILVDGENGLLTQIGDVGGIAEALERLLTDDALCTRLGNAAYVTAQKFHLETMVRENLNSYAEVEPELFTVAELLNAGN